MSEDKHKSNGVIRVGRKGRKKFAIGAEDDPRRLPDFEVDVVVAYQRWICADESFRPELPNEQGRRPIPDERMAEFHAAAVEFVEGLGGEKYAGQITTAEALDFCARLGEQYDDMADFFQRRSRQERASPATSEEGSNDTSPTPTGLRFSTEEA